MGTLEAARKRLVDQESTLKVAKADLEMAKEKGLAVTRKFLEDRVKRVEAVCEMTRKLIEELESLSVQKTIPTARR